MLKQDVAHDLNREFYVLDETLKEPFYCLRNDKPLSPASLDLLTRFWQKAGLPHAGASITAREIRHAMSETEQKMHALFYVHAAGSFGSLVNTNNSAQMYRLQAERFSP